MIKSIFAALAAWGLLSLGGCHQPPPPPYVPTATEVDTMYKHVVWTRNHKPYLDVWTRGVYIIDNRAFRAPGVIRFYLGNRWESFEYWPPSDNAVVLPAPNHNGPDRLIYRRTGEDISYDVQPEPVLTR